MEFRTDPMWTDTLGLCGFMEQSIGESAHAYVVAHLNGEVYDRNPDWSYNTTSEHLRFDFHSRKFLFQNWVGPGTWLFDPITGTQNEQVATDHPSGLAATRVMDRYIEVRTSGLIRAYDIDGTDSIGTAEWYLSGSHSEPGHISYGGDRIAWIAKNDGRIFKYDLEAKAEIEFVRTINMACIGLWYSVKYDIFISLHDNGDNTTSIRVWANEVAAYAISAPVALDPIVSGQISRIQVQVTGEHGEPIEGQLVDWSILSGAGQLVSTQSAADMDGYAEVQYEAPFAPGAADIQAEVTY